MTVKDDEEPVRKILKDIFNDDWYKSLFCESDFYETINDFEDCQSETIDKILPLVKELINRSTK